MKNHLPSAEHQVQCQVSDVRLYLGIHSNSVARRAVEAFRPYLRCPHPQYQHHVLETHTRPTHHVLPNPGQLGIRAPRSRLGTQSPRTHPCPMVPVPFFQARSLVASVAGSPCHRDTHRSREELVLGPCPFRLLRRRLRLLHLSYSQLADHEPVPVLRVSVRIRL